MITVQTLIEGVEDLVNNTVSTNNGLQFFSGCQEISQKCTEIKETLPFPLSESRKPVLYHTKSLADGSQHLCFSRYIFWSFYLASHRREEHPSV